jgi:pimeloyl-ACP methyl ester carboxylesterase
MMGNGDSDPPPSQDITIEFYAECLVAAMDAVRLERVDLYGHHTGAQVVAEIAIARPERVRRLVLDGVGLFPPSLKAEFLDLYAPAIAPEASGAHLSKIWTFITRTTQYFPHYRDDEQHRIAGGAPPPPVVATDRTAEVLKAWSTYHIAYGAAFRHDLAERLRQVSTPTLFLAAAGDPLAPYAAVGAALVEGAHVVETSYADKARAIRDFLDAADQKPTKTAARAAIS